MKKNARFSKMIKLILTLILILSGISQADELLVVPYSLMEVFYPTPNKTFTSINNALDNSREGDTITVLGGKYHEIINITNRNNITLIGIKNALGNPTILGGDTKNGGVVCKEEMAALSGPLVQIKGINIILKNFKIVNNLDTKYGKYSCGIALQSHGSTIEGNEIVGFQTGIILCNSSSNNIKNNYVDVKKEITDGIGIELAKSSGNIITCNLVKRGLINIRLDAKCFDNQISCNSLQESRFQNAYDPGEGESNEWDDGRIGNFYDDFQCDGANCPNRIIPGHNIDRYPISENLSREQRLTICQSSCDIGLKIVPKNRTYSKIGDVVEFNLTISNNGLSKLSNVKIKHNDIINDVADVLESHKSKNISVIYRINASDFPGPLDINFVVSGFSVKCDRFVYDSASGHVNIQNLSFDKSPDRNEVCSGEIINYTYRIENLGNATVDNLRIFDDKIGDITPRKTVLEPGERTSATGAYQVNTTDLSVVTNEATVYYDDPDGITHSTSDNASVIISSNCSRISLNKTANKRYAAPGENVSYDYNITNTGQTQLDNLILYDDKIGDITLPERNLMPGHSIRASADYTISWEEKDIVINNAIATGWDPVGMKVNGNDSERVDILKISFDKSPDRNEVCPGEIINYTYRIENLGNATVDNLRIFDDKIGDITPRKTVLEPGEHTSATGAYPVNSTDLSVVTNDATVYYDDPDGITHSTSDNASVIISSNCSRISLNKTANKRYAAPGENVSYDYNITNTGQTQLDNLILYDDKIGDITLPDRPLMRNQSILARADYMIPWKADDVVINNATATGRDPAGMMVNDTDSEQIDIPNLLFNKSPDREEVCPGEIINYTFSITNVGSSSVTPLKLFDDIIGEISINKKPLNRGQTLVANASTRAMMPGYLNNTATLEYADPTGRIAVAVAFSSLWVNADCIFFIKEASIDDACPGDIITYSFTLINRLDKQISGLTVIDDKLGPIAMNRSILGPGDQARGTKIYAVKVEDLPGPIVNLAEYTAYDIWNRKFTGQDTAEVRLISGIPNPCDKECCDCQSILINNYANISGTGQNLQVFSGGSATVGNISQYISQDHNANNTKSKIRSDEYH